MKTKKGFTLIELVVSMIVIGIAFYGLMSVLSDVTIKNTSGQELLKAGFLAEEVMEEMMMEGKDFSTEVLDVSLQSFSAPFSGFSYSVDVEYVNSSNLNLSTTEATDYKRIEVTVSGEAVSYPVTLVTVKANI